MAIEGVYRELGARIQRARRHAKITQKSLGAAIGHTRLSVSAIENARQRVQIHTLYRIAALLGVTVEQLLPSTDMPIAVDGERNADVR